MKLIKNKCNQATQQEFYILPLLIRKKGELNKYVISVDLYRTSATVGTYHANKCLSWLKYKIILFYF